MKAGKLKSSTLQGLLNASYDKKVRSVDGFQQDRALSTKTSKVYVNPETNQTVVAHKGTDGILDWGNNAVYALGGEKAYKQTGRFKEAQQVQREAQKKYGRENISTIGHSQGGLQAELLGKKGKETITLNKATRPFANTPAENQYDIRTQGDLVSALNPFQSQTNTSTIESNLNPLAAHSIDTLASVDTEYGTGLKVGLNNETTGTELDEMCKNISEYHGCFIKNQLPKLQNGFYIINLNGHSHWCCLYMDGNQHYYFDPFGFVPPTEVENKIKPYYYNDEQIQDMNDSSCGYYCVAFIKFMNHKLDSLKSYNDFIHLFSTNSKDNEKILSSIIQ